MNARIIALAALCLPALAAHAADEPHLVMPPSIPPAVQTELQQSLGEFLTTAVHLHATDTNATAHAGPACCWVVIRDEAGVATGDPLSKTDGHWVINASRIRAAVLPQGTGEQLLAVLLRQQCLRALAFQSGLEACPFNLCCLKPLNDETDPLKTIGDLCPPCTVKLRKALGQDVSDLTPAAP